MPQEIFNRSVQILATINASNAGQQHLIYDSGYTNPFDRVQSLKYYGFLTDLRMRIDINSLAESQIPEISLGTSKTTRSELLREMEYESPRIELQLLIRDTYKPWQPIFNFSCLNRQPFYITDMMGYITNQPAFALASDAQLAIKLIDVGYGLLSGTDEINIFGSAREEVTGLPSEGDLITQSTQNRVTVGNSSEVVLAASTIRKGAVLTNTSATEMIYLSYQPQAIADEGIVLYPGGGAFTINTTNLYKGAIAAISDQSNASLSVVEFL